MVTYNLLLKKNMYLLQSKFFGMKFIGNYIKMNYDSNVKKLLFIYSVCQHACLQFWEQSWLRLLHHKRFHIVGCSAAIGHAYMINV